MKNVVTTPPVEVALRTLDSGDRERVRAWFTHLGNWDGDDFVRTHSHKLGSVPGAYALKTSTDLWIFFTIDADTITILDVGKDKAILTSGRGSGDVD